MKKRLLDDGLIATLERLGMTVPINLRRDLIERSAGIPAGIFSASVEDFELDNAVMLNAIFGKKTKAKISAARYFVADLLSENKAQRHVLLGVTQQALWKFEDRHADVLHRLRVEFDVTFRSALTRHHSPQQPIS